ncbi:hypothetical protein Pth03_40310 [Planotetraspora thailandica]|uniref:DUF3806 domain-containing protein n=1 Tax=Planotetraspora thailandica TaxID=487172 RepID=A0A8J3XUP5_9ACTN|nr:hypothetical protein [Planotetraspora thailandica]GII55642.1 hypothetical protein Pth03_40310 [Planotetraspora thailandica]
MPSRTRPQPPSDAETAERMRRLAELFVEHTREDGYSFDWNPALIHHLDNFCNELAAARPPGEIVDSVIMGAGAYLGEMIVRSCGWKWVYCPLQNAPAVTSPQGLRGYPLHKVSKRIRLGGEHDLEAFFKFAATGEAPYGTTAREVRPPWWRRLKRRT